MKASIALERATWVPVVSVLLVVNFIAICTVYFVVPELSVFAKHFGVSQGTVGAISWVNTLGYGLANFLLGMLLKRFSMKRVLVISLACLSLANFATTLGSSLSWMLLTRFLSGLAAGMIVPTSWAYVFKYLSPNEQKKAVGMLSMDLMLAYMLGLPIGSILISKYGIGSAFVLVALACLVGLFCAIVSLPHEKESKASQPYGLKEHLSSFTSFFMNQTSRTFLLMIAFWSFGYNSLYSFLGVWVTDLQMPIANSLLFLIFGIGATLGCLYSTQIGGSKQVFALTLGSVCILVMSLLLSSHSYIFCIITTAWFFFDRTAFTHLFSRTAKIANPNEIPQFTTLVLLSLLLSATIGTHFVGELIDWFGNVGMVLVVVYVVSVVLSKTYHSRIKTSL